MRTSLPNLIVVLCGGGMPLIIFAPASRSELQSDAASKSDRAQRVSLAQRRVSQDRSGRT
jgi:hypothetical protein